MRTTVGTGAGRLVHEALAIFASHLWALLGWYLDRLWHSITGHRRAVAWHGHSIPWVRVVSRIVSGRWPITLGNLISCGLRHVTGHGLWHGPRWDERDLCLAAQVGSALDLHHGFETILHSRFASRGSTRGYADAEGECLTRTLSEVSRPGNLDVPGKENILNPMHLLNSLVVNRHPDRFFETLEDPSLNLDAVRLDVLMGVHVDLANNGFSLLEGRLVEANPNFPLRGYEMIE